MSKLQNLRAMAAALVIVLATAGLAIAGDEPTVDEQMAGLVAMCDQSQDARAARQAAEPLYDRLGGYDKIYELTTEIVRLHSINPDFERFWGSVDEERLTKNVTDFVSSGTGGPKVYTGRDMPTAHARLELSNADFLSAGSDVTQAMMNMGYGEAEIQELVCILVSMKDLVITK